MKCLSLILSILFASSPSSVGVHDFHLCKTDIHYKTDQESIQVTIHTFIDDTEEALQKLDALDYKIFESTEHPATDSILTKYLLNQLVIKVDGQPAELQWLGKEPSDDIQGLYSYIEILDVSDVKTLEIENHILMDLFDDQRNITTVLKDKKRKAFEIFSVKDYALKVDF